MVIIYEPLWEMSSFLKDRKHMNRSLCHSSYIYTIFHNWEGELALFKYN